MKMPGKHLAIIMVTLATPLGSMLATDAHANSGRLAKVKSEGFRACKALGDTGYTGIVRGRRSGGGSTRLTGDARFSVRYCFESRSQCVRFINSIEHILYDVTEVNYSTCSRR